MCLRTGEQAVDKSYLSCILHSRDFHTTTVTLLTASLVQARYLTVTSDMGNRLLAMALPTSTSSSTLLWCMSERGASPQNSHNQAIYDLRCWTDALVSHRDAQRVTFANLRVPGNYSITRPMQESGAASGRMVNIGTYILSSTCVT